GLAQDMLQELAMRQYLGAAEFVDAAGLHPALGRGREGLGDVADIDRLEAGIAADQRQRRQQPGETAHAVEEAVAGAEDQRRAHDDGSGKGGEYGGLAFGLAAR